MACLDGVYEGLWRQGSEAGDDFEGRQFDAQADVPTANTIARGIVDGGFDMVVTLTTPALQAMATANQQGQVTHVFGCVTDPLGAGVGMSPDDPGDHPAHLAGIGTFQPVERSFELAKELFPGLKKVGTVWTGSESNSEACVGKARAVCKQLGIELVEVQIDSSTAVGEAAGTLFTPAEINSAIFRDALAEALKAEGIRLESVAANTTSEVPEAAAALADRDIDVVCQISDNLANASFSLISPDC